MFMFVVCVTVIGAVVAAAAAAAVSVVDSCVGRAFLSCY